MTAPGRLATALAVVHVLVALPFARTPAEPAYPAPTVGFPSQQEAQISAMLHTVQVASGDLVGVTPSSVTRHRVAES
jgi:hypothetical protein